LAARLRILRNGSASDSGRESSNAGPQTAQPHAEPFKPNSLGGSSSYPAVAQAVTQDHAVKGQQIDDPYIFETDDIDDLLDGLDDFDLDDDFEASGNGRSGDNEDSRVSNILESLKPTGPDKLKSPEDEDDSDGEHMSRDVEKILAEVRDEIHLERDQSDEVATSNEASANITTTNDDPTFPSLPGVPRSLPVDTALDQADDSVSGTARKSLDFENDITSRLASLRGVGSGMTFDSFGLPTAPTFSPEDRSASTAAAPVPKRGGYTDEDQKTWCIVCLDDATIRCIGCDNDVYCLRCWKEMVCSSLVNIMVPIDCLWAKRPLHHLPFGCCLTTERGVG